MSDDLRILITTTFQKRVANPFTRLVPMQPVLETTGRTSGQPRRTPVGGRRVGNQFWLVSEFGDTSQWVRNIKADPRVRLRLSGKWRTGTAQVMPDDDARARLRSLPHVARLGVRAFGTSLLTCGLISTTKTKESQMELSLLAYPVPGDPAGLGGPLSEIKSAAAAGFSRVWMPQVPPAPGRSAWDALTVLGLAGAQTPRIELATGVAVAYAQHPLALARQALTVSAALDGRLILGIGVSHRMIVSDMLGYSYAAPAAFLREYLEVLGPALAGEPVDHHGQRLTAVGQLDLANAPTPPVITAALGPRMLDVAGELSDGTLTTWVGPKTLEQHIAPRIRAAAARAGRPAPQIISVMLTTVTNDVDAARASVVKTLGAAGSMPAYRAMLDIEGADTVADVCVIGDESQVAARLQRYAEAGATEFVASPYGSPAARARTTALLTSLMR